MSDLPDVCPACGALPCDWSNNPHWQTIETAPKDGTGILVIDMSAPMPEAGQAWFKHGVWTAVCPDGAIALEPEVYRAMTWPSPTHWMPLPEAPTPGAQS